MLDSLRCLGIVVACWAPQLMGREVFSQLLLVFILCVAVKFGS